MYCVAYCNLIQNPIIFEAHVHTIISHSDKNFLKRKEVFLKFPNMKLTKSNIFFKGVKQKYSTNPAQNFKHNWYLQVSA